MLSVRVKDPGPTLVRQRGVSTVQVAAVVVVVVVVVLLPWFNAAGTPMDEGALLAYAERVMAGDVLIRDLHSFYGPLNSYLVGVVLHASGSSLFSERVVGLIYRLTLTVALMAIVRRRGPIGVGLAGLVLALLLPAEGVAAYASFGALGLSCVAISLAAERRAALAGAAAAAAILMRLDWSIPLAAASLPFLVSWNRRERMRLLASACIGPLIYVAYSLSPVGPTLEARSPNYGRGNGGERWQSRIGRRIRARCLISE